MLTAYRDTPHIATGATPYELMRDRKIRTKLETLNPTETPSKEEINQRDKDYKEKIKTQRENRNTRPHNIIKGDCVLVEQNKRNKWSLPYEPSFYTVTEVNGSAVTARRLSDGRTITRDGSKFKIANHLMSSENTTTTEAEENEEIDQELENQPLTTKELLEGLTIEREQQEENQPAERAPVSNTPPTANTPPKPPEPENTREPSEAQQTDRGIGKHRPKTPQKRELPQRQRRPPKYLQDYTK